MSQMCNVTLCCMRCRSHMLAYVTFNRIGNLKCQYKQIHFTDMRCIKYNTIKIPQMIGTRICVITANEKPFKKNKRLRSCDK